MKEYIAPEFEKVVYEVEDCLKGSKDIEKETEDLSGFIEDLF